jgi:hypothetical protein
MPKLTLKITKQPSDPWILTTNEPPSLTYFTQENIDAVLKPYFKDIRKMPGLLNITESTDGNIKYVEYTFDTVENMSNSKFVMVDSDLAKQRVEIIRLAMLYNNITPYTIETIISHE